MLKGGTDEDGILLVLDDRREADSIASELRMRGSLRRSCAGLARCPTVTPKVPPRWKGWETGAMPIQASFGRKSTYRAYGINGDQLASEDLGSDEEAIAWARRLVKDGLSVQRLSREITAGFGMDIPLT